VMDCSCLWWLSLVVLLVGSLGSRVS
jgi:hypothetical protein